MFNNTSVMKMISVPTSFYQAWDWHCQSANSGGV